MRTAQGIFSPITGFSPPGGNAATAIASHLPPPNIQFQSPANLLLKLQCLTYLLHLHLLLFSLKLFKSPALHPCSPVTTLRLPPGAPGCDARDLHSFSGGGGKELELCGCPRVCGGCGLVSRVEASSQAPGPFSTAFPAAGFSLAGPALELV